MKRFKFNLESLLDIKRSDEERIMLQLAEKNTTILQKSREINNVAQQLRSLQTSEKTRRQQGGGVLELRYSVAYRYKLKTDILTIGKAIDDLRADAAGIMKKLVKATQSKKVLEKIKERKMAEWKKSVSRKEQLFIDDIAQRQRYT